jgi:hypothetical protein
MALYRVLLFLFAVGLASAPVVAQEAPSAEDREALVSALRGERATLLDLGLVRLQIDLEEVGGLILPDFALYREVRSGAYYNLHRKTVVAYLSVAEPPENRTPELCAQRVVRMLQLLLAGEPISSDVDGRYLERVFGDRRGEADGRQWGEELLDFVEFRVHLRAPAGEQGFDTRRVTCRGHIDSAAGDLLVEERS